MSVPPGGYAWWYVDALSADGRFGLSLIAFVGSVFSPYYAWRRRGRGSSDPESHVAINVAIYGADGYRWAMTERGRHVLARDVKSLEVGPSRLTWESDGALVADIDEIAVPFLRRIRGRLRIRPLVTGARAFDIHPSGAHVWQPIAPRASIEVDLERPHRSWTGTAYVDHNRGAEPLESAFKGWSWSRTIESRRTRIYYDTVATDGTQCALHVAYEDDPQPLKIAAPPLAPYGASRWRLPLIARSDGEAAPRLIETWEDGPFYARCLIRQSLGGERVRAVHETISLERFANPIVQAMLPFRMPRALR